ncbi:hypothetical protein BASA81_007730 [Batrachochytrium salamandrivorans]|nr:hypothetical protein BASA81_007730 [Batrachochytrium salamandrivorans]
MASEEEGFADRAALPTLRGSFQTDTGVWSGHWAMNEYEFFHGLKGEFEYKRTKKQVPQLAHKSAHGPSSGIPQDMYLSGYFTYQEGLKKTKVSETAVLMRFHPQEEEGGVVKVTGHGTNANGGFNMLGSFHLETQHLQVERAFISSLDVSAAVASTVTRVALTTATAVAPSLPLGGGEIRARRSRIGLSPDQIKLRDFSGIVDKLKREDKAQFFWFPVDPVLWPDYPEIVTRPMDFSTILGKLANGQYHSVWDAEADVGLVFSNAQLYNPALNPVYEEAKRLRLVLAREMDRMSKTWQKHNQELPQQQQGSEEDDADFSDSGLEAPFTSVSKSGRKTRPPQKLKKATTGMTSPSKSPPIAAQLALAAAQQAAHQEEIRRLQARISQLEAPSPVAASLPLVKPPRQSTKLASGKKQLELGGVGRVASPSPIRVPAVSRDDIALTYQEQRVLAQQIYKLPPGKRQKLVEMLQDVAWGPGRVAEFNLAQQPIPVQRAMCKYIKEAL